MFWSLILEPSKRYTSTVNESFHLSMATLDVKTAHKDNEVHPVCIQVDDNELLLCNLSKPHTLHASLDLEFEQGSKVTFYTSGKATIHLTGYLTQDNYSDAEDYSSLEEEEDETFSNLLENSKGKKKGKGKEELKQASPNKRKLEPVEVVSKKKSKNVKSQDSDSDDDDDDSSVDENELGKLVESINEDDVDTDSDDEDDDEEAEAEEDSDGEEELGSELNDSDLDSDDEISEEETPKQQQKPKKQEIKTPQQNKQKTPVSNKKQEKQQGKNQLTNGVTPTSSKKDKKDKNQANLSNLTTPKQDQKTPNKGKEANATPQSQKKQTVAGGVIIEELKQGNGPPAKHGKMVAVYYTGRLKNNNRVFDQSNQGPGFKFRLGNGEVIKGWDVGLSGMKVGSKRRLTIPPGMGYGNKGSPPQIPPNSTLVFDVELKSVN